MEGSALCFQGGVKEYMVSQDQSWSACHIRKVDFPPFARKTEKSATGEKSQYGKSLAWKGPKYLPSKKKPGIDWDGKKHRQIQLS